MEAMKSSIPTGCQRLVSALLAVSLLASAGCAQLPRLDPPPVIKGVDQLGSANSFSAPPVAWPADGWWRAYGDPQLGALIEEALHDSPDLEMAKARLHAAMAAVQGAGATRIPEVTGNALLTEGKQSYNYLIPRRPCHRAGTTTVLRRWICPGNWISGARTARPSQPLSRSNGRLRSRWHRPA